LLWAKHADAPIDNVLVGETYQYEVDLAGACEVIYWMLTIQNFNGMVNVIEGKWGPNFLPQKVVKNGVMEALRKAKSSGLCKNRLWNLLNIMERREVDLPGLMESTEKYPAFRHEGHGECETNYCEFNHLDTTKMKQLHKIEHQRTDNCPQIIYPVKDLEISVDNGKGSVWSRHGYQMAEPGSKYVAISHVWLDGTGIGAGGRAGIGKVNKCLADFFLRIVDRLHCDGIWWDTISLPTNALLRKKCIDNMHENYRAAAYTVLHDNYLLNFEWADDGSPCIAIVLSSWFTRGWTALELHESRRVKVLFKSRDPHNPRIMDLDDHILAKNPATASRAHWIASSIIQRLRRRSSISEEERPIANMRDLLAIILPRSVCRIDDKTTISGLLAHLPPIACDDCNAQPNDKESCDRTKAHITKHTTERILTHLPRVGHASLLHGKPTLNPEGPFSWAPAAVYDMPVESAGDLEDGALRTLFLSIDAEGGVSGSWWYRGISAKEIETGVLRPIINSDEGTISRVKEALKDKKKCILLREAREEYKKLALLVTTVGKGRYIEDNRTTDCVDCRYVGAVKVAPGWEGPSWNQGRWPDPRYGLKDFRLGHDKGKSVIEAREVLEIIINPFPGGNPPDNPWGDDSYRTAPSGDEEDEEGEASDGDDVESIMDEEKMLDDLDNDRWSDDEDGPGRPKWFI
jgi:hypothetical protein